MWTPEYHIPHLPMSVRREICNRGAIGGSKMRFAVKYCLAIFSPRIFLFLRWLALMLADLWLVLSYFRTGVEVDSTLLVCWIHVIHSRLQTLNCFQILLKLIKNASLNIRTTHVQPPVPSFVPSDLTKVVVLTIVIAGIPARQCELAPKAKPEQPR